VKYIGSKSKLAKYIIPFIEPYLEGSCGYIEPFVGGANLIDKISGITKIGADGNKYLIAMWKALQNGWLPPGEVSKEAYKFIRKNYKSGYFTDEFIGFVGHNCSFSGDWFAGYAGTGETRNRCLEAKKHLLKQIEYLKDVDFIHCDYRKLPRLVGCVFYLDPPYYQGMEYRGSDFSFNHEEFWDWCRKIAKDNILFLSDYYAPDDFELIWEKDITVNVHQNKKKQATERLYKIGTI
jgi:DNA adenine methylase